MNEYWVAINLSSVVTDSFIGKVAFELSPVDIWSKGISAERKTNAKVLRFREFKAQ